MTLGATEAGMKNVELAIVAAAAIALIGCGSSPAASRSGNRGTTTARAAQAQPGCGLDEGTMARAPALEMPGTRVSMLLPHADQMLLVRGMSVALHECGLAAIVIAAPLDGTGREFLDGAVVGSLRELEARGFACQVGRSGEAWRCSAPEGHVAFVRRVGPPESGALVTIEGPREDERALQRIAGSVTYDPSARFDPLEQMSIALEVPEGMSLSPSAGGGFVIYEAPGTAGTLVADVRWQYVPYATLDDHVDGSAWDDRELGRVAGELASEVVDGLDASTMRPLGASADETFLELAVDGQVGGVPVVLYVCAARDEAGVFYALGRIATPLAATWIPRLRAHAATLRALD